MNHIDDLALKIKERQAERIRQVEEIEREALTSLRKKLREHTKKELIIIGKDIHTMREKIRKKILQTEEEIEKLSLKNLGLKARVFIMILAISMSLLVGIIIGTKIAKDWNQIPAEKIILDPSGVEWIKVQDLIKKN